MNVRNARFRILAATLLSAAALPPLATAAAVANQPETLGPNIAANGGFERGSDPGEKLDIPAGAPSLEGWTTVGPAVRVVGTYWQAQEGTRSLSLTSYDKYPTDPKVIPPGASGVRQTLTTLVGQRYRVTFYQASSPFLRDPSIIRLAVGGTSKDYTFQSDTKASPKAMQWVQRSIVYTATTASTPLAFYALYTYSYNGLGLDNVQVRAIRDATGAASTPTSAKTTPQPAATGAPTLQLGTASIAAGAQQTVTVSAAKSAALALIVDYPDGTQLVLPSRAGADGTYRYSWSVPATIHGTVQVMVDSAGSIVRASFTVS